METQEIVKVTNGTTAIIAYECAFADSEKKTVSIGSFRTQDIPSDLKSRITTFNSNPATGFSGTFVSSASGAAFTAITGATVTVKAITVLI